MHYVMHHAPLSSKRVLSLLTCVLCAGMAVGSAQAKSAVKGPGLSTPQKTVQSFVTALNKHDLNAAASCVQGSKPKTAGLSEIWNIQAQAMSGAYALEKATYTTTGHRASAQLEVKVSMGSHSFKRSEKVRLTRQTKNWLIVPLDKTTAHSPNVGFLQSQAYMLAQPAEIIAIFKRAKATAQKMARENRAREDKAKQKH